MSEKKEPIYSNEKEMVERRVVTTQKTADRWSVRVERAEAKVNELKETLAMYVGRVETLKEQAKTASTEPWGPKERATNGENQIQNDRVIVSHDSSGMQGNGAVAVPSAPSDTKLDPDDIRLMSGTHQVPATLDPDREQTKIDNDFDFNGTLHLPTFPTT